MAAKRDFYEVLGIDKNADEATIKKAYRKLAKKYHPDMNKGNPNAEKIFQEVTEAYEVLGDPKKRKLYDEYGPISLEAGFDPEKMKQAQYGNPFGNISRILPENQAADIRSSILMVLPIWMIFLTNCLEKKVDSTEPEVLAEEADLEVPENLAVVLAEYMRKEGKISRRKYRSALKKRYLAVIKGLRFLPVTERARTLKCIFRQALQTGSLCV